MSVTVEELISRVRVIGADDYDRAMKRMQSSGDNFVNHASNALRTVSTAFGGLIVAAATGAVALGVAAVKTASEYDSLKRGLLAVMGNAKDAAKELLELREVAKLPGLGLFEAIQGSINLQAAGYSAKEARESLLAFGNALATVGKGKESLDLVNLAITQMANETSGFGQEIRQLLQQLPQTRQMLLSAFGTADTEAIANMGYTGKQVVQILTTEFAKLPRVTGGALNSWENFTDSVKASLTKLGTPLLKPWAEMLDTIGAKLDHLASSGALSRIGHDLADILGRALNVIVLPGLRRMADLVDTIGRSGGLSGWARENAKAFLKFTIAVLEGVAFIGLAMTALGIIFKNAGLAIRGAIVTILAMVATGLIVKKFQGMFPKGAGNASRISGGAGTENEFEGIPDPGTVPGGAGDPYLRQIAGNTRLTAENTKKALDIRRLALGGGELGRIGVTPVELEEGVLSMRRRGLI